MSGDDSPRTCCPFLRSFTPAGRAHVYQLCTATGEAPLYPSATELVVLCRSAFESCPRYVAACRRTEAAPAHEAPRAA